MTDEQIESAFEELENLINDEWVRDKVSSLKNAMAERMQKQTGKKVRRCIRCSEPVHTERGRAVCPACKWKQKPFREWSSEAKKKTSQNVKRWQQSHPEALAAIKKRYSEKHRDQQRAYIKEYMIKYRAKLKEKV